MSGCQLQDHFIMASASPRRQALLQQLGLRFRVVPSHLDEGCVQPAQRPETVAESFAVAKAATVASQYPHAWVLAADTIVVVDGDILGKPADGAEAAAMLQRLSGRPHWVLTGVCLTCSHLGVRDAKVVGTRVFMKAMSAEEIAAYVATGEPLDKAGAYGIQGLGACLVTRIEGSYSNVVGLPLFEVVEMLRRHGVVDPLACRTSASPIAGPFDPDPAARQP